jgi:hypothetical protein
VDYVDTDMYYQEYQSNFSGECGGENYMIQADHSGGTAFPGTNTPPVNPFGGCTHDTQWGYDHLVGGGGTFSSDLGTAQDYSRIASIFGFNFGGHTGFTTNITHDYSNTGSATTYLCGTGYMPDVPVLYNTT